MPRNCHDTTDGSYTIRPRQILSIRLLTARGEASTTLSVPANSGCHPRPAKPGAQGIQVVEVIGGGVAGKARQVEVSGRGFAQLLHPDRPPSQDRPAAGGEPLEEKVRGRPPSASEDRKFDSHPPEGEALHGVRKGLPAARSARETPPDLSVRLTQHAIQRVETARSRFYFSRLSSRSSSIGLYSNSRKRSSWSRKCGSSSNPAGGASRINPLWPRVKMFSLNTHLGASTTICA